MAAISDYLQDRLINYLFRSATSSKSSTLAIALCTELPNSYDTGATIAELPNTGAYARQILNPSDINWEVPASNGTTSNLSAITFPAATLNWGRFGYMAILDSATWGAGNLLFSGALSQTEIVHTGDIFRLDINQLIIQIT
jgi:hypothetical protein